MTIKHILAVPNNRTTHRSVEECALRVAQNFAAHIDVLHVRARPQSPTLAMFGAAMSELPTDVLAEYEREERRKEDDFRASFDEFVRRADLPSRARAERSDRPSANWSAVEDYPPDTIARRGGAYDLIVLGRPAGDAAIMDQLIAESALFATGRPVLVAPPEPPRTLGERVLIGWNRSAPAARAFHAAKSLLLEKAKQVRILSITTGAKSGPAAAEIADNLAWHGIAAEVRELSPDHRSIGNVLLSEASAIGADLLVMGAYSQSRLRQMVLGGVTKEILANATLPVFMAH
jgi:nucleotide-binding universal stress UspA family protein